MVTFDLNQQGNINYPNVLWQNPDPGLPKNFIFGVYHDMVFSASDASEIYYSTVALHLTESLSSVIMTEELPVVPIALHHKLFYMKPPILWKFL